MSKDDSNLSSTGFDYVVAVTQDSINGTLKEYLFNSGLPEVVLCYVYDANNNLGPVDYQTLIQSANGTDPFSVPDGTATTDPRVQNLSAAGFSFAIKAKLGLPPQVPPSKLLPIIGLKPGQSDVTYTLMFAEFVGAQLSYGPRGATAWFNQSQPGGTSWTFTGAVDLNLQDASFTSLSASAQQQIEALGSPNMFSVQQLYYDLNNSNLEGNIVFQNMPANSDINGFMANNFVSAYWKALDGSEVLGYGVNQTSGILPGALPVTAINFFTPDAVGPGGAPLTLNYLCAANHDPLPDTTHAGFGWNWIDPLPPPPQPQVQQFDGVAALNRNTLIAYLRSRLDGYVSSNCIVPSASVATDGLKSISYTAGVPGGGTPAVTSPAGPIILMYSYRSSTAADNATNGSDTASGSLSVASTFTLFVMVQGSQMTIVQHLVVACDVGCHILGVFGGDANGNIVDLQIDDTYTYGVDAQGNLVVTTPDAQATPPTSLTVDNSDLNRSTSGFPTVAGQVGQLFTDLTAAAAKVFATRVIDIPMANLPSFILPGGATFAFADASFSNNQDLVSNITYLNQMKTGSGSR